MHNHVRRYFSSLALLCFFGFAVRISLAADDISKRPPFDRYTAMINKSPFAVVSAVPPPAATPNFAKDLYVANAARTSNGDLVTVQSATDRDMKEYLTTKGPNEHGYSLWNIEWSDKPGQTKVTISRDGQFARLGFNPALRAQAPPGGGQPQQPAFPPPAYIPPRPRTREPIQRNPNASQPQRSATGQASEQ
jgi:hypothetical protein